MLKFLNAGQLGVDRPWHFWRVMARKPIEDEACSELDDPVLLRMPS
jgi:hypothetical protein